MITLILSGVELLHENITKEERLEYIGPWCLLGSDDFNERLDSFNSVVNHKDELKECSDASLSLAIKSSNKIATMLNKRFNRNHTNEYWRILTLPALITLSQCLIILFRRLNKTVEQLGSERVKVYLFDKDLCPTIENTRSLFEFISSKEGTHFLFGHMIYALYADNFVIETIDHSFDSTGKSYRTNIQVNKEVMKRELSTRLSMFLSKFSGIFIEGVTGASFRDLLQVSFYFFSKGRFKSKSFKKKIIGEKVDVFCEYVGDDVDLDRNLNKLLISAFENLAPNTILRDYLRNEEKYEKISLKISKNTKTMILGPLLGGYDPMKFISAKFKEDGGSLVINQHGSNYGTARCLPYAAGTEYLSSDLFITWGWRTQANYVMPTIRLPSPLLSKKIKRRQGRGDSICLIGTQIPLFPIRLHSNPMAEELYKYRDEKVSFIESLNEDVFNKLVFKPYFTEYGGLPENDYLKSKFHNLTFLEGDLNKNMPNHRLNVIDHPGTSINISMAWGIPTLFYWDRNLWDTCEQFDQTLEELYRAGIYHTSGASAAQFININYATIEEWWNSSDVIRARNLFCSGYAYGDANWHTIWADKLYENLE